MKNIIPAILVLAVLLTTGFDFSKHSIPVDEIRGGGTPKDGIPALTNPKFVPAAEAQFIKDKDKVLGVEIEGQPKAYPVNILNWHEGVNDTIKNSAILVTW